MHLTKDMHLLAQGPLVNQCHRLCLIAWIKWDWDSSYDKPVKLHINCDKNGILDKQQFELGHSTTTLSFSISSLSLDHTSADLTRLLYLAIKSLLHT